MISNYQKTVYSAARIPHITTEATIKPGVTLNISLLISSPFGLFLLSGSETVIRYIKIRIMQNTQDIRFKNGIGSIAPPLRVGKNLNSTDKGMVSNAAVSAALEVVLFQKNPSRKMAKTPGDINPTYSCIN